MDYMKGFRKAAFEADHFVFKRGCREKHFSSWPDVQYHFGLSQYTCNERDLEDGKMSKVLYDNLCHVYGEAAMAAYFPASEPQQKRARLFSDVPRKSLLWLLWLMANVTMHNPKA